MKHKRFDTKNLYFSNTYLLKVSTKDTGKGKTLIQYILTAEFEHICIKTQQKRDESKYKDTTPVSLSAIPNKHVLLKLLCFDITNSPFLNEK